MGHEIHQDRVTAAEVKRKAASLGFDLCGIAPAAALPELGFLRDWLDRGFAGEMDYLQRSAERRVDVRRIMPAARSVISLGTLYNTNRPYSTDNTDPRRAAIARYAWGDDYHELIGCRLDGLIEWLRAEAGPKLEARAYVDTGPVQERVYAQRAGLGWIGKNTCLINPDLGSWVFLAEVICNLNLDPDAPAVDQCGSCTRCIDSCPTGALVDAHVLDSTRCLSYLTIELKGAIPAEQREGLGEHAYGCDICQEVCPWNIASNAHSSNPAWLPRAGLDAPRLVDLWLRTDDELRNLLTGSAMKRAGVRRFRRNLAVSIGNSGDPAGAEALATDAGDTCADPLVREHIAWALEKLGA